MDSNMLQISEDRVKDLFNSYLHTVRLTEDKLSKYYVFDNQIETAKEIIYNFYTNNNRWCLLFAEMQSGKSGTFFSVPYIISRNSLLTIKLNVDMFDNEINVFLLTGMNEKELISQFERDIDGFTGMSITKNVLHNSEMRKFLSRSEDTWSSSDHVVINRMKKNSLILIDESHYGSDKNQILDKFLKKILNINPNGDNTELVKNNIYVVSISATPMAEFINANISDFNKKIIPLKNASGYFGIQEMFNQNRVYNSYDLKSTKSIDSMIDSFLNIKKNGYLLLRCPSKNQELVKKRIGERMLSNIHIINYDQYEKSRILDNMGINDILNQVPTKKTIIFLKGLLRAGKRVDTTNVVMVHDTSESKVDTTVQSLLGRCCGYGKNKDILIYCDKTSAEKYKKWIDSEYNINMVPDKSRNVIGQNKIYIQTYRDPIEFNISKNTKIIELISKRKSKSDKIEILKMLGDSFINSIINSGKLKKDYDIGSIFNVDITKHEKWINGGQRYTSYQKQYLDVINNKIFMGDYKGSDNKKLTEEDLDKIVFSAAYEINSQKILISFGCVVRSDVYSSEKSMYHDTNKIG